MSEKNILRQANKSSRPEPNVEGSFECQQCRELVLSAYYDSQKQALIWYCEDDHVSVIEEFVL